MPGGWTEETFKTSQGHKGVVEVRGWVRDKGRHVGLYFNEIGAWWLVHLNSGHGVCRLYGAPHEVVPVATRLADCADWSFQGITGWQNTDPDLPKKIGEIWAGEPRVMPDDIPGEGARHYANARQVAVERMEEEDEEFAKEHGS